MENLASAGFTTSEIMSAMPGLLDLAASSGESLANSSDIAASTLRGFGLAASDAGHVADVLAKNAAATNAAVADTGEAMKYISPVAQTAGWSLESVTAAIGELANSGIKGSQAGTILRATFSRLAKPSDESAKAMAAMGFSAYDSQHKMKSLSQVISDLSKSTAKMTDEQKQNTIAQVFGEEAMSGILTLIKNGSGSLDELTQSYINSDGAAKEMASTMQDNAKSAIEQMTGSLETAAIKLEETFAPKITEAANYVQDLANQFSELSPEQQDFYIKMALGAAAIGPVVKLIGGLTTGIGKLISIGSKLGPLLGITTAASAGVALGAVAALGVGMAAVQTHNELMAKSFDTSTDDLSTWGKMINVLTGSTIKSKKELVSAGLAYEDFSESLSTNFKSSVEDASKSFNKLRMTLAFDSRNGVNFSDSMSRDIKNQVDVIVKSAKDAVMNKRSEMESTLSKLFNLGDGKIDDNESKVMDNIASYQDSKFDTIQTLNDNIYNTLNKAVEEHKKLTEDDINNIKSWTKQIQALQIESSTVNESDGQYASNQGKFEKRLGSMTADEALSSTKDFYNQIIDINQESEDKQRDIISKAQALKPGLNDDYTKALSNGETEKAESLKNSIETIEKKVTEAQDKLNNSVKERSDKTKDLWDAFYNANPNMKGHINEINFTKFSWGDEKANSKFQEVMKWYPQIADVTETCMKRIQNADNTWSDIAITVDKATGKIVSIYDTTKGTVAGYSDQFVKDAENTYGSLFNAQAKIKSLMNDNGKIGLNMDNNLVSIDGSGAETVIEKMQKVIKLADGYRLAIANVNGTQIKMEFDKDGVLQNYEDVLNAINGDKSSKAIVNIDVNDKDALESLKNVSSAADTIPPSADIHISTNANEATNEVNETKNEINSMEDKTVIITTIFKKITQWFDEKFDNASKIINDHSTASSYIPTDQDTYDENRTHLGGDGYAVGTNNATAGIHPVAENGFEIIFGRQNKIFNGGEKVLTHEKSKDFLQKQQNNEPFQVKQGQFQLAQLQKVQVAGGGGNSVQVDIQVNGSQDVDAIIQQATQEVGRKLKEALTGVKK